MKEWRESGISSCPSPSLSFPCMALCCSCPGHVTGSLSFLSGSCSGVRLLLKRPQIHISNGAGICLSGTQVGCAICPLFHIGTHEACLLSAQLLPSPSLSFEETLPFGDILTSRWTSRNQHLQDEEGHRKASSAHLPFPLFGLCWHTLSRGVNIDPLLMS